MPNSAVGRPAKSSATQALGGDARTRLLQAGLRQFAEHGFSAASTRAIAGEAQTNVASISYHFGDKEGLYRAVLTELSASVGQAFEQLEHRSVPFAQALEGLYRGFMGDLDADDQQSRLMMKIHLRECADPSLVFKQWVRGTVGPMFLQLENMLMRELGLVRSDVSVHRLAFALISIANDYWMSDAFMAELSPQMREKKSWLEDAIKHLSQLGMGMLDAEKTRRACMTPKAKTAAKKPVQK
jgi:TetR/AcrR family transcriptional regulator, regulator of cefoperazone and chloramphenicol sensitivity